MNLQIFPSFKKKYHLVALLVTSFYIPHILHADHQPGHVSDITNPLGSNTTSIFQLLNTLIDKILIPIGIVLVTLGVIYSGFLFVSARGNPDKLKRAKQAITWTLIGGLIVLGARVIAEITESTIKEL